MHDFPAIKQAADEIRHGRLRPIELLERCLDRIDRFDSEVRAWVAVDEAGARRDAEQMTREAAEGRWRGPLHGIPIGVKDIIDVGGMPTRAGSPLREHHIAPADAPVVAALRRAGAVIIGKTVTVEFACFDPSPTRNPWNLEHTPGGSSSGSAAAVAMGMCPAALGTQTGGSLVRPAGYCGVATFKPSLGRLSTAGIVPVSPHLDQPGPMARTVDDLMGLFGLLDGSPAAVPPDSPRPFRLGVVEPFFMEQADEAVRQVVSAAADRLRQGNARIGRVTDLPAGFEEILPMHWRIMAVDAAAYHRDAFLANRAAYGPMITTLLDDGLATAAVDYSQSLAHQREMQGRVLDWFGEYDALIVPSTDTTAPPTLTTTGPRTFQAPWSYCGLPVAGIPCGVAADGLPVGLQIVGRYNDDWGVLSVARWCEQQLRFDAIPPLAR